MLKVIVLINSITDNGTGDTTLKFYTNMNNINYINMLMVEQGTQGTFNGHSNTIQHYYRNQLD